MAEHEPLGDERSVGERSVSDERSVVLAARLDGTDKRDIRESASPSGSIFWPKASSDRASTARPRAFKAGLVGVDAMVADRHELEVVLR